MRRLVVGPKKRGQVWIETVIYTLIGLAVIGLVLAVAKPKIDQKKDEVLISQAIESLMNINDKVYEVQRATGNRRAVDLIVGKGKVIIDMEQNEISWLLDSSYEYSEAGVPIQLGGIQVTTIEANPWQVELLMAYPVNIIYDDMDIGRKEFDEVSVPYKLIIENSGIGADGKLVISIWEA